MRKLGLIPSLVVSRITKFAVIGVFLLGAAAWGAEPHYFPLGLGNLWVYETGGTRCCTPLVLEITQTADFNGNTYFLLHGFPRGDHWLRTGDDGSLLAYDPERNEEKLWYDFQAPVGEVFDTAIPYCCGQAVTISRNAQYSGPTGELDNALEMGYPGVFQIGISQDLFLPDVGLGRRIENTGGPSVATYELVYARVGGETFGSGDALASGITGKILLGPTCPVVRPGDPKCADKPYQTQIVVKTEDGSREVTRFSSNGKGEFRVRLPGGTYRLESATSGVSPFPRLSPILATVEPNKFTTLTIHFDSGIR